MFASTDLPRELRELTAEYTLPSFRLRGDTIDAKSTGNANLRIYLPDGNYVQVCVKSGLWFAQFTPYLYTIPNRRFNSSYRVLLLYHSSVNLQEEISSVLSTLDLFDPHEAALAKKHPNFLSKRKKGKVINEMGENIKITSDKESKRLRPFYKKFGEDYYDSKMSPSLMSPSLILCSEQGPLLNIAIDKGERTTVKINPNIFLNSKMVGIILDRSNYNIENKALQAVWDVVMTEMEKEVESILKEHKLFARMSDDDSEYRRLEGATYEDIKKLFSKRERVAMFGGDVNPYSSSRNLVVEFMTPTSVMIDTAKLDEIYEEENDLDHPFDYAWTRRLADLLLSWGDRGRPPPVSPATVPQYTTMYFDKLRELEAANPHAF